MSGGGETSPRIYASQEAGGLDGASRWYALAVKPRHEKAVHRILETKGQETFLPLYRKPHRYARRQKAFHLPLFPGYVFCRCNIGKRQPIVTTPGVIRILGSGSEATPIEDSEIASLQRAINAQAAIEPWPFLQAGEKVWITEGALAGVEGILIEAKQGPRIILSVSLLQRSVLLEVDRAVVRSVSAPR